MLGSIRYLWAPKPIRSTSVAARDSGSFDYVPEALRFEVLPGSTTPNFFRSKRWQMVHVKGRWEWNLSNSEPLIRS